ncbi:hypothetical protein [Arthrobacter sp. D5-1]|uniref:hypothetical protein n=1 Tax=Arthrobacter sp. D5-1 TaxID=1477518 RepID=UPI001A980CDF|nr:hypothetical protein [Arthrobacter sp. D5-1]QSZ49424.1 hypothetical protein AYX22_14125 [Arthrobacter sp. D5-1]
MFTSILRTIVPALWGSFIAWAIGLLPALEPHREALLGYGTPLSAIVAAVLIAAWYAFWRWLERRLPSWFTRAVLGSAQRPSYTGTPTNYADSALAEEIRAGLTELNRRGKHES